MKPHLWRGQWLDDDELANQLPHLGTQLAADLDRPPPLSALLQAAQALGQSLQQEGFGGHRGSGGFVGIEDRPAFFFAMTTPS